MQVIFTMVSVTEVREPLTDRAFIAHAESLANICHQCRSLKTSMMHTKVLSFFGMTITRVLFAKPFERLRELFRHRSNVARCRSNGVSAPFEQRLRIVRTTFENVRTAFDNRSNSV